MKDLTPEVSEHKLTDRKKMILRSVIESHINNGEPVGSKYLVSSANIPYSSATIRAEMAELEEMGYLEQPHTSSGRVPTQQGYRFYVDSLMESYKLTGTEIIELNNMLKSKIGELDSILASASKLVASMTNYTSVAIKSGNRADTIKNFSYMLLDEREFLLVMKMENGKVISRQIRTDVELSDRILFKLEQQLNSKLCGLTSKDITLPIMMDIENEMGVEASLVSPTFRAIYETMGGGEDTDIKYEGITKLFDYPEFSDVDKIKNVMDMLDDKKGLIELMSDSKNEGVNITIGNEESRLVDNSALIYRPIKVSGQTLGVIGVFGPARMDYSKVVSTVEYLSEKITSMRSDALPPPSDDRGKEEGKDE